MLIDMAKYFGTNGIRGTIDVLTPELAGRAGYAVGAYFKGGKILLAYDARKTGPLLKEYVVRGLVDSGSTIIDLGMVSTPTAEFMVKKLHADGLIIITASHNPPEYNGLKVTDGNEVAISKERGEEIEKLIDAPPKIKTKKGTMRQYEWAVKDHVEAMRTELDAKKTQGKRVLLDCGNGMAATIAPHLFRALGCEVTSIHSHIDGSFPGRPSEPTENNVRDLIKIMKIGSYDCGIAWDGDGDRVIMVDERGDYIIGDKVFAVSVMLKLRQKKGTVVTTVATSRGIEEIAKKNGAEVAYTKIGAPYLSEAIVQNKAAVMAGEEVGGVIWPEISLAKDGFLTAAKIVEALCEKKLSEWVREIPNYYNKKTKIDANDERKLKIINSMREYAIKNKLNYRDIDGVRIDFEDAWVIVRASGTEGYVRIFSEAKSEKRAQELLEEYVKVVEDIK